MPEALSISTGLAKERLGPMLQAAGLPDLEVQSAAPITAWPLVSATCAIESARHSSADRQLLACEHMLHCCGLSLAESFEDTRTKQILCHFWFHTQAQQTLHTCHAGFRCCFATGPLPGI